MLQLQVEKTKIEPVIVKELQSDEVSESSDIDLPDMFEYEGLWFQLQTQNPLSVNDLQNLVSQMVSAY